MWVQSSVEEDGRTAKMTVSTEWDEDHKFEVWAEGNTALVEHEESLLWRGQISTEEPDEDVYKALMTSDKMTAFLESRGLDKVKRAAPTP